MWRRPFKRMMSHIMWTEMKNKFTLIFTACSLSSPLEQNVAETSIRNQQSISKLAYSAVTLLYYSLVVPVMAPLFHTRNASNVKYVCLHLLLLHCTSQDLMKTTEVV